MNEQNENASVYSPITIKASDRPRLERFMRLTQRGTIMATVSYLLDFAERNDRFYLTKLAEELPADRGVHVAPAVGATDGADGE